MNAQMLTRPNWKTVRPTGRRIASAAPSAAPDDVPSTYGSASGLRTMPWNVAPATARPAPTRAAVRTRGIRSSQTIVSVAAVQWPPRSSPRRALEDDPERVRHGPIWIDPTVTPATSEIASTTRPITAIVAGRPRIRAAMPTGRSSAGRLRVAMPTRYGVADAAGDGRTRSGYIARARLRIPVARRGPGRVISVSVTDRTSPVLTAVNALTSRSAWRWSRPSARRTR